MLSFFKKQPKQDLTAELARKRLRNEARFKAMKERMIAEGKHITSPSFKWISADEFAMKNGL